MFRYAFAASLLAGLVACAPSEPAIDLEDPYASLYPWDPEREGVVTTESGLQYIEIVAGPDGGASPAATDSVTVDYDGRLAATGEKFDSSYDRGSPSTFGVNRVIAGWTEALQLMSEGDEWMLHIPADLAYGDQARGEVIKAGSDLMFRVNLNTVTPTPPPPPPIEPATETWATYTPWDSAREGITKGDGGFEYVVIKDGVAGDTYPEDADVVAIHYEMRSDDKGTVYDSTLAGGQAGLARLNEIPIEGMRLALTQMRPGDHWLVYMPSALGFGEEGLGPVPPNENLVIELNLLDFQDADLLGRGS